MPSEERMSARSSIAISALLVALLALGLGCGNKEAKGTEVMLAVAASLRNVTPELARVYGDKHPGTKIAASYGARQGIS